VQTWLGLVLVFGMAKKLEQAADILSDGARCAQLL
jgi:hypothetical protein